MPANEKIPTMHLDPKQMWLPLTAVFTLVAAVLAAGWAASQWKGSIDRNTVAVEKLEQKLDFMAQQALGFKLWIASLAAKNPGINVPEIPR